MITGVADVYRLSNQLEIYLPVSDLLESGMILLRKVYGQRNCYSRTKTTSSVTGFSERFRNGRARFARRKTTNVIGSLITLSDSQGICGERTTWMPLRGGKLSGACMGFLTALVEAETCARIRKIAIAIRF